MSYTSSKKGKKTIMKKKLRVREEREKREKALYHNRSLVVLKFIRLTNILKCSSRSIYLSYFSNVGGVHLSSMDISMIVGVKGNKPVIWIVYVIVADSCAFS